MSEPPFEKVKVAIVGMGTVGAGVAKLLLDHGDRTARHAGKTLWLEQVVVRDVERPRDVELPEGVLSDDLTRITGDPEIKVVAQLTGGVEPARTIMLKLLQSGKDIVTANKALLAEHGPELFDRARELGRAIAFEASVAGGVPIITNLSQCLSANQTLSLQGILNGTCNFILGEMEEKGAAYEDVLAEAQRLGYAEADPTMDVSGGDTVQKLAILAHLAFGARMNWRDIPCEGIDNFDPADITYANELGYRIKLLAVAELTETGLEMHVSPTLVEIGQPLAEVRENYNAIRVVGDAVGPVFYHGQGAGQMPTASAVVADMIDMAVGRTQITFETLQLWSDRDAPVALCDHAHSMGRYYLRFVVDDHPGVLAQIAGILGENDISIASVLQREAKGDGVNMIPLVIMTHKASEGSAREAMQQIDQLDSVMEGSVKMRVAD